jgi:hypothetical protein
MAFFIQSSMGLLSSQVPTNENVAAEESLFADQDVVSPEPSPEEWARNATEKTALGQVLHSYIIANIDNICESEHSGQTSKLTLLTVAAGFSQKYMRVLAADRQNLAKLNDNAEVCIVDHGLIDDRDLAWSKVVAIRALLEVGKQTIVWMDADALAFNPKSFADIETQLFPESKSILFTNDFNEAYYSEATERSSINCGVMISRNTAWTTQFWKSVWEDFPAAINDAWWEQRAVLMYREAQPAEFAEHTRIIPHRIMNTKKSEDKLDDFIIHASGGHIPKYDELLRMYCEHTRLESCN